MKLLQNITFTLLALTAVTGTVNAKPNMEFKSGINLITDKAVTMELIAESLAHPSLSIESENFQKDLSELLALKPYMPKSRFFDFGNKFLSEQTVADAADE
jgi:hypothetical protein